MTKKNKKAFNKNYKKVQMAVWNPWGLPVCNERLNYYKLQGHELRYLGPARTSQRPQKREMAWKSLDNQRRLGNRCTRKKLGLSIRINHTSFKTFCG